MRTAIVLYTRDLRVHDHLGLSDAVRTSDRVLPLFVLDNRILGLRDAPNRVAFLLEALADLATRSASEEGISSFGAGIRWRRRSSWREP